MSIKKRLDYNVMYHSFFNFVYFKKVTAKSLQFIRVFVFNFIYFILKQNIGVIFSNVSLFPFIYRLLTLIILSFLF